MSRATAGRTRAGEHPPNFGKTYPVEVLTEREVLGLIGACSLRGAAGVRDRALIVVLWRGGLRIGEALALYPKDIDLETGTVSILHGKGDRSRTAVLDPQALEVLERWIERRTALGLSGRAPLFCSILAHAILAPQAAQLLKVVALQTVGALTSIERGLLRPVTQRL